MSLRGSLMARLVVAVSLASSQLGFGLVLVQQRAQRLEHEVNMLAHDSGSRGEPISDGVLMGKQHDELSVAEIEKLLWNGMDVPEDLRFRAGFELGGKLNKTRKTAPEADVQVFGLQNTGTNLMFHFLRQNFGDRLVHRDIHFNGHDDPLLQPGVWKHSNIQAKWRIEPETISSLDDMGVVPIIMVRNPMSWLQSMQKAPYELKPCIEGRTWLTRECVHPAPGGHKSLVQPKTYNSIQGIWNVWNTAFRDYKANGFSRGVVVEYEDLVEKPEFVMWQIATYLNMSAPADGWVVEGESSKAHGDSHGRDEALDMIRSKSYLETYEPEEKSQACDGLNADLLEFFGYSDCNELGR